MYVSDTIVALSSGRLPSGIAVIRLSGPKVRLALEATCGALPPARLASVRHFREPGGSVIDQCLLLFFETPNSFTGEDTGEIHLHGGRAVVAAVLACLTAIDGIRHAEPGEFTRRAFLNGKLDLLQAEAVADLIAAETEAQRRLAESNREGVQSRLYESWRQRLIHGRAMIEAELDFADESDVPGSVAAAVWEDIERLAGEIERHIESYRRAEIIRDGFDVVIVGAPNVGKSSLLNVLASREAAIVSDEPGTTRDLVELVLDLEGLKVRLTDTAGIREGAGKVEAQGIERALKRAATADLVLHLLGPGESILPEVGPIRGELITVGTKADLLGRGERARSAERCALLVSSKTGEGIDDLADHIASRAREAAAAIGDVLPSRMRHVELLRAAAEALQRALQMRDDLELCAEDLRVAADRIGRISGAVDVEDLLDVIFSTFCIGK